MITNGFGIALQALLVAAFSTTAAISLKGPKVVPHGAAAVSPTAPSALRISDIDIDAGHLFSSRGSVATSINATSLLSLRQRGAAGLSNIGGKKVAVISFSRSGSTTMMDLVKVSTPSDGLFALFEPCHNGDVYEHRVVGKISAVHGCPKMITDVVHCKFANIQKL